MTVVLALEGRNIVHRYGEVSVLNGVSIALVPGSIHAVLGENGAGKSTLLKVLAGVEPLQGGVVCEPCASTASRWFSSTLRCNHR
jgi:ribose transport system ATP-binding protein